MQAAPHVASTSRPPRRSSDSHSSRGNSRDRKKSIEEREEDATTFTEKWLGNVADTLQHLASIQQRVHAIRPENATSSILQPLFESLMEAANNVHIVTHNIINVLTPLLPPISARESMDAPNEIAHVLHVVQRTAEAADKTMEVPYLTYSMRISEAMTVGVQQEVDHGSFRKNSSHHLEGGDNSGTGSIISAVEVAVPTCKVEAESTTHVATPPPSDWQQQLNAQRQACTRAALVTSHYGLQRSVRSLLCQVSLFRDTLERSEQLIIHVFTGQLGSRTSAHMARLFL